jgi:hypothetical protein
MGFTEFQVESRFPAFMAHMKILCRSSSCLTSSTLDAGGRTLSFWLTGEMVRVTYQADRSP